MKEYLVLGSGALVAAMVTFAACSGQSLDLGDNQDPQDASSGASNPSTTAASSPGDAANSEPQADAAEGDDETWSGYVENYAFPSGSDALLLTLTREADGGVIGHAIFGNVPLYPPPTDGSVGYPLPDPDEGAEPDSLEGFRYSLLDGSIDGIRLRAVVAPNELYVQWCALQTPQAEPSVFLDDGGTAYGCVPPGIAETESNNGAPCTITYDGGAVVTVNCAKEFVCQAFCVCTASSCTSPLTYEYPAFDFQFDGAQANGSILMSEGDSSFNIHLTRQ